MAGIKVIAGVNFGILRAGASKAKIKGGAHLRERIARFLVTPTCTAGINHTFDEITVPDEAC